MATSAEIIYEPFKTYPISKFRDELAFEFENLPAQLFDYYILRAARQMCCDGKLVRRRALIEALPGVTRYRLESPDCLEICAILHVEKFNECGCFHRGVTRTFVPPSGPLACCQGYSWFDDQDGVITIDTCCCSSGGYHVALAVTPSRDACELPAVLYDDHLPLLTLGAKAAILQITGRKWTNVMLGAALAKEFTNDVKEAAVETATHKQRGRIKMQFGRAL